MAEEVTFQADIAGIPSGAVTTLNYVQGLLKAASADNVAPLAVRQLQDLGTLFHCNGPWAERLPDLLQRSSSFRLQRLGAWAGWAKGDVPSHMSLTAGGRASSLLCFILSNMMPPNELGRIIYRLSENCLPLSQRNSSMSQISQAATCVASKLQCLGFGNHTAEHATRIRLFFLQSDTPPPELLTADVEPGQLIEILEKVSHALREDHLALHISGTRSMAWLVSAILALCPDDVLLDIDGSIVQRGHRDNIHISIPKDDCPLEYRIESRINPTAHPTSWLPIQSSLELQLAPTIHSVSFVWEGSIRAYLTLMLLPILQQNCNLDGLFRDLSSLVYFMVCEKNVIFTYLGPDYELFTVDFLSKTLVPPIAAPGDSTLTTMIDRLRMTTTQIFEPTSFEIVTRIVLNGIFRTLCQLCVVPSSRLTPILPSWNKLEATPQTPFFGVLDPKSNSLWPYVDHPFDSKFIVPWKVDELQELQLLCFSADSNIHGYLLGYQGQKYSLAEHERLMCHSEGGCTLYPMVLENPKVTNPRSFLFRLIDGHLWSDNVYYSAIATETFKVDYENDRRNLDPLVAKTEPFQIVPPNTPIAEPEIIFRLRPKVSAGRDILILRAEARSSTWIGRWDFWHAYEGYWNLIYAEPCPHYRSATFNWTPSDYGCISVTVIDDVRSGNSVPEFKYDTYTRDQYVSLFTSNSGIAQFLQCRLSGDQYMNLYQGDCCLSCAFRQATKYNFPHIICGSSSTVPLRVVGPPDTPFDRSKVGEAQELWHSGKPGK